MKPLYEKSYVFYDEFRTFLCPSSGSCLQDRGINVRRQHVPPLQCFSLLFDQYKAIFVATVLKRRKACTLGENLLMDTIAYFNIFLTLIFEIILIKLNK